MRSIRRQNYLKMLLFFVAAFMAVSLTSIVALADAPDDSADAAAMQGEVVSNDEDAVQTVSEESGADEGASSDDEESIALEDDSPAGVDEQYASDDVSEVEEGVLTAQADSASMTLGQSDSIALEKGGSKTYAFSISKATVVDVTMELANIDASAVDIVNMTLVGHDVGSAGTKRTFYNTASHVAYDPSEGKPHNKAAHRWILSAGDYELEVARDELEVARAGSGNAAAMNIELKTEATTLTESFEETLAVGSKIRGSSTTHLSDGCDVSVDLNKADSISLDTTYYGTETEYVPNDCYKIEIKEDGRYTLKCEALNYNGIDKSRSKACFQIGNLLNGKFFEQVSIELSPTSLTESAVDEVYQNLSKGTYYVIVNCNHDDATSMEGFYGQYSLSLNKISKANPIKLSIAKNNVAVAEADVAKADVAISGMLKVSGQKGAVSYHKVITDKPNDAALKVNDKGNIIVRKGVTAGTYTIKVNATAKGGLFDGTYYDFGKTSTVELTVRVCKKPTWSGASSMPVKSTADYKVTYGGWICLKVNGKWATSDSVVSLSAPSTNVKRVTAKKAGTTTLYLFDASGKQVATKKITVYDVHGKTYEFESSVNKNYVLDIQRKSKYNGAQMIVYRRNGGNNQKYRLFLQSDGTYAIKSVNSGKWLTVESKTNKYVQQWTWKKAGNNDQRWRITVDASNRVTFVNVKTNKCFDVQHGKTKNGAKMIVYKSNNGLNQKWKLNQK